MQAVAAHVLAEPDDVRERIARSRSLHRAVATAAHREVAAAGIACRPPTGAFYLYPDFAARRAALAERGVRTGADLAEHLLERHGVGVLAGEAFGDDPSGLRVRMATSLMYGAGDDEREQALASDDPAALPWIRAKLDRCARPSRPSPEAPRYSARANPTASAPASAAMTSVPTTSVGRSEA